MATWDFTGTGTGSIASSGFGDRKQVATVLAGRFDLTNANGIGFGDTFAVSDVIKFFTIQKGWLVLAAGLNVVTVCDATSTLTVGDSGSSTRYLTATAADAVANTDSTTAHFYTATDYIASTVGTHAIAKGVVEVWAVVVDCSYKTPSGAPSI